MNPDLPKMVKYAMTKRQIINMAYLSNGVVLPPKEFIDVIKNKDRFCFFISDYRPNEELKPYLKIDKIMQICKENNIKNCILDQRASRWMKPPKLLTDGTKRDTKSCECWLNGCYTYYQGKLFFCPIQFYSWFNGLGLESTKEEIIDMFDDNINAGELLVKSYTNYKKDFCQNCEIYPGEFLPVPAVQTQSFKEKSKV